MAAGLLGLGLGAAFPVHAQRLADTRIGISQFQDSLSLIHDTTSLKRLEVRLIGEARRARNDPVLHLKLGFLSLRIGDLGDLSHYNDAASEFQWATQLAPVLPDAWFGLGLSEFALGQAVAARMPAGAGMLGKDAAERSAVALAQAAITDPAYAERIADVAGSARAQQMPAKGAVALDALRQAAGDSRRRNPRIMLALGRVEREFGEADAALSAFDTFLAVGANRPLGLLEVARTRFLLGRLDGAGPYYEGAVSDDSVVVRGYRADLATIASDAELVRFDGTRGRGRVQFLHTFWGARDAAAFRADGERLREHYRRLFDARRMFPEITPARRFDFNDRIAAQDRRLDDRGVIYVRHGPPDDTRSLSTLGVEPNESWRYLRPGQDLVLHFVARQDPTTFRLVESLHDIVDVRGAMTAPAATLAITERRNTEQLFRSREGFDPVYQRQTSTAESVRAADEVRERALGRASIIRATSTDSYRRTFRRNLGASARVQVLEPLPGGGRVSVAWAVPGANAESAPSGQQILYPVRIRLVLLDGDGAVVATLDTLDQVLSAKWVPRDRWVQGRVELVVPSGVYDWRLLVQQGDDAATELPRAMIEVARAEPGGLTAGDVLLGSRSAKLVWERAAGDSVFLNPVEIYRRSEPLEVQQALRGTPAGRVLQSQVTVIRNGEGGSVVLNRKETLMAGDGTTRLHHEVDIRKLKAGSYTIELTVTDGTGQLVRRWADFTVTEP